MGYGRYVVVRGLNALLVLFVAILITVSVFSVLETQQLEARAREELQNILRGMKIKDEEEMRRIAQKLWESLVERYGLNEPLYIKVFKWMYRSLILDFGEARQAYPAYGNTKDVRSMILTALARTALLFTTAELIALAIGILLGLFAAYRRGGFLDRFLSVFALTTNSIPMYWLGMILILFFAYTLNIFPPRSWEYVPEDVKTNTFLLFTWYLHHMALPLITIIFVAFGGLAWYTRNIALGTFQEDFIMVAWAKGLPEKTVLYKHVLRAISPPITTMSLFAIVNSFFGAIISEVVFQWPGMGRLYYSALSNTDTPVVLGVTYLSIILIVLTKYILDLIYGFLDPRIKTA